MAIQPNFTEMFHRKFINDLAELFKKEYTHEQIDAFKLAKSYLFQFAFKNGRLILNLAGDYEIALPIYVNTLQTYNHFLNTQYKVIMHNLALNLNVGGLLGNDFDITSSNKIHPLQYNLSFESSNENHNNFLVYDIASIDANWYYVQNFSLPDYLIYPQTQSLLELDTGNIKIINPITSYKITNEIKNNTTYRLFSGYLQIHYDLTNNKASFKRFSSSLENDNYQSLSPSADWIELARFKAILDRYILANSQNPKSITLQEVTTLDLQNINLNNSQDALKQLGKLISTYIKITKGKDLTPADLEKRVQKFFGISNSNQQTNSNNNNNRRRY